MVKKTMEKNDSTMPPLRFKIIPHHYVDEDGMGSNRRELSIYGQKTIKFKLLYLDGVWQFEIEEFTLGKCFDTRLLENIEELREELIKNVFSDERTVEEHYQSILDYIGQYLIGKITCTFTRAGCIEWMKNAMIFVIYTGILRWDIIIQAQSVELLGSIPTEI